MRKTLLTVLVAAALVAGGVGIAPAAEAKQPPPRCHTFSVVTTQELRDVTGKTLGYFHAGGIFKRIGNGIQSRDVTTTKQRCRGKLVFTTTTTTWKYLPGQGPDIIVRVSPGSSGDYDEQPFPGGTGYQPIG